MAALVERGVLTEHVAVQDFYVDEAHVVDGRVPDLEPAEVEFLQKVYCFLNVQEPIYLLGC